MSKNFIENRRVGRVRASGAKLILPFLVLAIAAFAASFFSGRMPEPWMETALYSVAGAGALLLWLLPLLRYLSAYVDIYTTRILSRSGLFGQHRSEANYSQVTGIERGKGGRIVLRVKDAEDIELPALPGRKRIMAELERLIAQV